MLYITKIVLYLMYNQMKLKMNTIKILYNDLVECTEDEHIVIKGLIYTYVIGGTLLGLTTLLLMGVLGILSLM